ADLNSDLLNLLSSIQTAILMVNTQGQLRRFTPAAEKLLNLVPTDVGRSIPDAWSTFDLPDMRDLIARVVESATPIERELKSRDGKWYSMRIHPYRNLEDRIDGAVVLLFDIDLLKRTIDQANRSRDYAESLVETVREPLVLLDPQLKVRTANRSFFEAFRVFPSDIEEKSLFALGGGWEESGETLRLPLEAVIRDRQILRDLQFELDVEGIGKKVLVANARPVQVPGEPESLILLAVEDVTERFRATAELQDSEARYRRLFEAAREAIWLLDGTTGEILDTNPFSTELFGFDRDELVGRIPWAVPLYSEPDEAKKRFDQALRSGQSFAPDVAMKTRDGRVLRVEKISSVYTAGNRKVVQWNMRDLTERKRLEEELRHAQRMESIGTLAGGIAHDFNNILNIISAYSTLLARSSSDEKRTQSVEAIEKAVERGAALVRQLLTFARHEVVKFEPVDVNAIVSEVASMITETFPRSITISLDLAPERPKINADAGQLHQALLNLCVNARDAMPEGGTLLLATALARGEVLRSRRADAGDDRYVCIGVADTGVGMDEDTQKRIFEPFFTTKGKERGSGLGLAVVYGVAETHGGFVEVDSEPGGGSRFSIYLPMRSPDSEQEHPQRDASHERRRKRNETILV
ncbi:MAG TPA: PAS domain S-box protein, partial [Thermoanaerobaculia bacterium]|nr:PAS domain S-box protein [Thermoanaerobaculia bacterium]